MAATTEALLPTQGVAQISSRAVQRLRNAHPWIYRSDIVALPKGGEPGVVGVADSRGRLLGTAFFSPASTMTLRMVSWGNQSEPIDAGWLRRRLEAAEARRQRLLVNRDAYRLAHGEADFLPGVFIDRYNDCFVVQTTCAAADRLEPHLVAQLVELYRPRAIVVRDDVGARAHEQLAQHISLVHGEAPVVARYHEGAVEVEVDLLHDQKTGGFLDQVENHQLAARYGKGKGIDCCTYHGGFALQLARSCEHVVAYDIAEPALVAAQRNAQRCGLTNIEFVRMDVFAALPQLLAAGRRFDTVVLDPPAFASRQHTLEAAGRAYKEINLRAMKLLAPHGILITCSCSGRLEPAAFDAIIVAAARDARRQVYFVERRSAGPDHPVLAGVAETDYLKCRVLLVV